MTEEFDEQEWINTPMGKAVSPAMPFEILGDGEYTETIVKDGKIIFTLKEDFIKRITRME